MWIVDKGGGWFHLWKRVKSLYFLLGNFIRFESVLFAFASFRRGTRCSLESLRVLFVSVIRTR